MCNQCNSIKVFSCREVFILCLLFLLCIYCCCLSFLLWWLKNKLKILYSILFVILISNKIIISIITGLCIILWVCFTYCKDHPFHLSFICHAPHDGLILCMKRWATKSCHDSSDETSYQKIPSNWFPKIILCRNKLGTSTEWKKGVYLYVCVSVWEEIFTCSGEE